MKKLLKILGKAKEYIGIAIKYLGQLLGLVKKAEEELKKTEDKPE
jgi:hypothetical protein